MKHLSNRSPRAFNSGIVKIHARPKQFGDQAPYISKVETVEDVLRRYLAEVTPFHALVRSAEWRLLRQTELLKEPLLDLGCGDGYFASLLFEHPPLAGIDPEFSRCREARSCQAYQNVITADSTAMPFPNRYFRTIVANCVLEHIPDIDGALREIFRVLIPGGHLLFGVPGPHFAKMLLFSSFLKRIGCRRLSHAYGKWFNRHSLHFHTDEPAVWLERLTRHGFSVRGWEYYMDKSGLQAFDLAHYCSLPNLVIHKLTGKWVVFPFTLLTPLYERWLMPHVSAKPATEGPYIFFRVCKPETL
jgi:ubiquinone/menaquinone biosynthesis C-methylase UbiE